MGKHAVGLFDLFAFIKGSPSEFSAHITYFWNTERLVLMGIVAV